jgi:glycosyltransferase involved in cell wall biosynthesis
MNKGVSIIIPALNEENYIENVLKNLSLERIEHEVIVADAGSKDKTLELAKRYNAKVVTGGLPSVGRNAGARQAKYDLLVFLDADTYFEPGDLERMVTIFQERRLGIATCRILAYDGRPSDKKIFKLYNHLVKMQFMIKPQFPGFCIITWKQLHDTVNGFDETIQYFEDAHYTERIAEISPAGIIDDVLVHTSARRLRATSRIRVMGQVAGCWFYRMMKREVRNNEFKYKFDIYNEK